MSENKSHSIWPFVFGFLAGAAVGLLLAPEKGEVSRKKLKNKAEDLKGKINPAVESLREKSGQLAQEISQKAEPIISGFKKLEELENEVSQELRESYDEEEILPVDTSLSDHQTDLPSIDQSQPITAKPKRKIFFKNIR